LQTAVLAGFIPERFEASMLNHQEEPFCFKSPQRITITLPYSTHELIFNIAAKEGRSASNLCSFIIQLYLASKT